MNFSDKIDDILVVNIFKSQQVTAVRSTQPSFLAHNVHCCTSVSE